jgi:formate dehydrogenase maturation protein FdhE
MTLTPTSVASASRTWDRRIRRAEELANAGDSSAPLLVFYARVLRVQRSVYASFNEVRPVGSIESDATTLAARGTALLHDVAAHGPGPLAAHARLLLDSDHLATELVAQWQTPSDRRFFAKALLQPYGEWLTDAAMPPAGPPLSAPADNRCPRCGGAPQLSILSTPLSMADVSADGGSRQLQCANCLFLWSFRRVRCPNCGEEDEHKLGYFRPPALDYIRVDACDCCRHYLKSIDLGRLGIAVPLVDEVAAAPLDAWACDHGYQKIELNLLGL